LPLRVQFSAEKSFEKLGISNLEAKPASNHVFQGGTMRKLIRTIFQIARIVAVFIQASERQKAEKATQNQPHRNRNHSKRKGN
jgi:hypothetical protein